MFSVYFMYYMNYTQDIVLWLTPYIHLYLMGQPSMIYGNT